jgi:hypothetical protein
MWGVKLQCGQKAVFTFSVPTESSFVQEGLNEMWDIRVQSSGGRAFTHPDPTEESFIQ